MDKALLDTSLYRNCIAAGLVMAACASAHAQASGSEDVTKQTFFVDVPAPPTNADAAALLDFQGKFRNALDHIVGESIVFKGRVKIGMTRQQLSVVEKCIRSPASCRETKGAAAAGTGSSDMTAKKPLAGPSLLQEIRRSEWLFIDANLAEQLKKCMDNPTPDCR